MARCIDCLPSGHDILEKNVPMQRRILEIMHRFDGQIIAKRGYEIEQ